ncbi:alpha/beta hydrolase [Halioxenophilus sp. WMMB6]|uniref:alpha/beta hydrolase n=1 Tax=Halioxenophilus sp. WMMB6 TaxID=3073815 RepID=UPI00295E3F4F|nr:alpha/beta hydrolase [Halioxenophilus sp. WMMB6]
MYIVTNRAIKEKGKSLKSVFLDHPNQKGPKELRLVSVVREDGRWKVDVIDDEIARTDVEALNRQYNLNLDLNKKYFGSLRVACELFDMAVNEGKSVLFFLHGFNNDITDIVKTAHELEKLYNVIVIPFSWPANGGGPISGTLAYLEDKSDARVSVDAFNRFIGRIKDFHAMLTEGVRQETLAVANARHPDSPEMAGVLYARLISDACVVKLSLLCHSMGNYLFKRTLSTSETNADDLIFDNICLVAADTNREKHEDWVEKLDVNGSVYIVINENDYALKASRIKPGKQQKVRLGHSTKRLNAENATYIDVTDASHVGNEHAYFKGDSVEENNALRELFLYMFNGGSVEHMLEYRSSNNTHVLR